MTFAGRPHGIVRHALRPLTALAVVAALAASGVPSSAHGAGLTADAYAVAALADPGGMDGDPDVLTADAGGATAAVRRRAPAGG
ncbi:MAG TPA: hypothetical protein VF545_01975 [Thermoleophilaceae bacterium]